MTELEISSNLLTQTEGVILGIQDNDLRVRLMELGFLKGKKVKVLKRSSWSHSVLVLISGQVYALRKEEAQLIQLSPS